MLKKRLKSCVERVGTIRLKIANDCLCVSVSACVCVCVCVSNTGRE